MGEIKWIKINTCMFEDEKLRLIDAMPERDTIHYIWIRLLVQAGKTNANGYIFLNENIPYTEEMLSTIFNRPINSIRLALTTLKSFQMIEINDDKLIKIKNWEKHQNIEGMDRIREQNRKRVADYRKRKKIKEEKINNSQEELVSNNEGTVTQGNVTVTEQKEKEREKEDIEKEVEVDIDKKENKIDENEIKSEIDKEKQKTSGVNESGMRLLAYYEKITGKLGVFNLGALNAAVAQHGEEHVKMAIEKAIEVNVLTMKYVNGILRNWVKEGYPEGEVYDNGKHKSNSNEFEGFKPQESRKVSDEERKSTEEKLI